jgi:hypothetical protein
MNADAAKKSPTDCKPGAGHPLRMLVQALARAAARAALQQSKTTEQPAEPQYSTSSADRSLDPNNPTENSNSDSRTSKND